MRKSLSDQRTRIFFLVLCCFVLILGSVLVLNQKEAFFLDEYYSYGCANGKTGKTFDFSRETTYTSEEFRQLAVNTYGVAEGEQFRFDWTWNNLSTNVHPPLFYAALHLVCSLTPGVFSEWQAGIVNIIFGLIGLLFFQKIIRSLIRQEWLAGLLCLTWTCTLGLFGTIVLLRDYAAAMCGSLMVFWEALRCLRGHHGYKDWIRLGLASAFCALSHFYCLIYLFFLCGMLCVLLMLRKEWRGIFGVFISEMGGGIVTLLIFPTIISRILYSKRGGQAKASLKHFSLSEYKESVLTLFSKLNRNFFGNLLPCFAILLALLILIWVFRKKAGMQTPKDEGSFCVSGREAALAVIPPVCYFAVIAQISTLITLRYLYPIAAVAYLSLIVSLAYAGEKIVPRKVLSIALAGCMILAAALSWQNGAIEFMYTGMKNRIDAALSPLSGTDAVIIQMDTDTKAHPNVMLPQLDYYQSVTVYKVRDVENPVPIQALEEGKNIVLLLYNNDKHETCLQHYLRMYPDYTADSLGTLDVQSRFTNYYFHKD